MGKIQLKSNCDNADGFSRISPEKLAPAAYSRSVRAGSSTIPVLYICVSSLSVNRI